MNNALYGARWRRQEQRRLAADAEARQIHRRILLSGMFSRSVHGGAEVAKQIARLKVPALKSF